MIIDELPELAAIGAAASVSDDESTLPAWSRWSIAALLAAIVVGGFLALFFQP